MKIKQYLFAVIAPMVVAAAQFYLWDYISPFVWFFFFPTVFFAARYGGIRCAMISALLSAVIVSYVFLPPQFSWQFSHPHNLLTVAVFLAMGYLFGDSQERLMKARNALQNELDKSAAQSLEITQLYEQNLALDDIKFSQLADSLPMIVWATTSDGKNIFFNEEWYRYTGLNQKDSSGDGWLKPFHPDDQASAWKAWENAVASGKEYSVECRLRRADGLYQWWLIRGIPTLNREHQVEKWFGTCANIDGIKGALEELSIEKSKLQTIFDNSPDGLAIITTSGMPSIFNSKYMDYFGIEKQGNDQSSLDNLRDKLVVSTLGGELLPPSGSTVARALQGEAVVSQELHLKNILTGREWYGSHSATPIRDSNGAISGAVLSVRNITESVQEKKRLVDLLQVQDTVLNSGITGIAKTKGRKFQWVNQYFLDSFGYSQEELLGQSTEMIYPDKTSFEAFGEEINGVMLHEGVLARDALQLKRKDGSLGWYLIGGGQLSTDGDEAIWTSIDVTQDYQNQELLAAYTRQLKKSMEETLLVLSRTIEMRDPYTAGHQQRVGVLAEAIGKKLKMTEAQAHNLNLIGLIHDIGKIGVPAEILTKPTMLTPAEYELVKNHVTIGHDILKGIGFLNPIAQVIYQHHERLDGSGYPLALKSDQILFEAKIIAVADVVESMAANRPYRASLGIEKALEEIEKGRGSLFDSLVVDACLELFRKDGYQMPVTAH